MQDSKPWRLHPGLPVTWLDVDQPGVMQLKQQLLQEAGAAGTAAVQPGQHGTITTPHEPASADTHSGLQDDTQPAATEAVRFPLLVDCWRPVAADLSQTPLSSCLECSGFDQHVPTVWLAEALLYYLPLEQVSRDVGVLAVTSLCKCCFAPWCSAACCTRLLVIGVWAGAQPAQSCYQRLDLQPQCLCASSVVGVTHTMLPQAFQLLSDMRQLSAPGSMLVATCIDR